MAQRFQEADEDIRALAGRARVAIGAAATAGLAEALGAELLPGDLIAGAAGLSP